MSESDKHSRSEQPTAKKLEEARKKSPPRSQEFATAFMLLASVASISWLAGTIREQLGGLMTSSLQALHSPPATADEVHLALISAAEAGAYVLVPFLFAVSLCAIVVSVAQGGVMMNFDRLAPDITKLNPLGGLDKLMPKPESLLGVLKAVVKLFFVALFVWQVISGELDTIINMLAADARDIAGFMARISFKMLWHVISAMLVLAIADLVWVRWNFIRKLRMTKQEVRLESRDSEGDPLIKGQIRKRMLQSMARRLLKIIPEADVVITNPTHFAVALKYDKLTMAAPIVIAKGVDEVALKIREIARASNVPVVENRPLARDLYASVRERQPVPERLYNAIAEVLSFVYRLKGGAA